MNAMLIGADTLGNIPDTLAEYGIRICRHISGRNAAHQRKLPSLPKETELMILFTDFLGHNVMRHFRELANEHQVRFVACRRSVCALKQSLDGLSQQEKANICANCKNGKGKAITKRKCD